MAGAMRHPHPDSHAGHDSLPFTARATDKQQLAGIALCLFRIVAQLAVQGRQVFEEVIRFAALLHRNASMPSFICQ